MTQSGPLYKKKFRFSRIEGLFFISPWIIGFIWLQLYPFLTSLYYSFTDYSMIAPPRFIGFGNFIRLFTIDPEFWMSMRVTGFYAFMVVPGKLIMALTVAMLLNMKLRSINLYRTVYYLPSILGGSIAISVVWKIMFMRDGVINQLIANFGFDRVDWLGSPKIALGTISLLSVWQFGSSMVLFLAALKQIPQSLYEAAIVDGAGKVRIFFKIVLPMISPIIFFNLIMQMIGALQEFTSAFVITNGGPAKSTFVLGMKLYNDAFKYSKMGYASALSWIMFVIVVVLTLIVFRSSNAWVTYADGGKANEK